MRPRNVLPSPRWAAAALLMGLLLGATLRDGPRADQIETPAEARGQGTLAALPEQSPGGAFDPGTEAHGSRGEPGVRPVTVTVLGPDPDDPRWLATREAVDFWNRELAGIRARIRFVRPRFVAREVPPALFRHRRADRSSGRSRHVMQQFAAKAADDADILVLLADTAIASYASKIRAGALGAGARVVVALQDHRTPPLSYPNVARNVVAHELGHVLGLKHGSDPSDLMCGSPASCGAQGYRSLRPHFLALTDVDRARLARIWGRPGTR